jgi:hypothetical protein
LSFRYSTTSNSTPSSSAIARAFFEEPQLGLWKIVTSAMRRTLSDRPLRFRRLRERQRDLRRLEDAMSEALRTTSDEARRVGDEIGVDWSRFDLEQFRLGMDVELEHGSRDPQTDVTGDDPILTGKIALAHMKEFPDYYERLERMEQEAERDWAARG